MIVRVYSSFDNVYSIKKEIEKTINTFLFTFERGVNTVVKLVHRESTLIVDMVIIVKYYDKQGEEKERIWKIPVHRIIKRGREEIIFKTPNEPSLETFFLIYTLIKGDYDFDVFRGDIRDQNIENYEIGGKANVKYKNRITIDGLTQLNLDAIETILIQNRQIPIIVNLSKEQLYTFIISVNTKAPDVIQSIDLVYFSKLDSGRLYIYRDDYEFNKSIKPRTKKVYVWKSSMLVFDKIIDLE